LKYIQTKDELIRGKDDLITDLEAQNKSLQNELVDLNETHNVTTKQLQETVHQYMSAITQLNEKETIMFNVSQDNLKMKSK